MTLRCGLGGGPGCSSHKKSLILVFCLFVFWGVGGFVFGFWFWFGFFCLFVFVCVFVLLFRATPMAFGGSQARSLIGATAASLHHSHSNARSKPQLRPTLTPDP